MPCQEFAALDGYLTRAVDPSYLGDARLTHVTASAEICDRILREGWVVPTARPQHESYDLPQGVWISVNGSWEDYCKYWPEEKGWTGGVLDVELNPGARLLKADKPVEAWRFHRDFPTTDDDAEIPRGYVDWTRVAAAYDGIYFANYCEMRQESKTWYWWDVDCVCMFDASKVRICGRGPPVERVRRDG